MSCLGVGVRRRTITIATRARTIVNVTTTKRRKARTLTNTTTRRTKRAVTKKRNVTRRVARVLLKSFSNTMTIFGVSRVAARLSYGVCVHEPLQQPVSALFPLLGTVMNVMTNENNSDRPPIVNNGTLPPGRKSGKRVHYGDVRGNKRLPLTERMLPMNNSDLPLTISPVDNATTRRETRARINNRARLT